MKLRQARKVLSHWHLHPHAHTPTYGRACRRVRRWKRNSPQWKIARRSWRFADLVESRADPTEIRSTWDALRLDIIRDWGPPWDDGDYAEYLLYALDDPLPYIQPVDDIRYYSDRWCPWRVGRVEAIVHFLEVS